MTTALAGVTVSSVNMEDRKNLGIKAGDTVRVHQKIDDKGKTRIQVFEGLVLARKHGAEAGATFTVRKIASGVGVEKIFPLYSPAIDKIEIIKRSKVRRAKLYYIREKVAREIKRQMRRMHLMDVATESEAEMAVKKAEEEAKASEVETSDAKETDEVAVEDSSPDTSQEVSREKAETSENEEVETDKDKEETPERAKEEEKKEEETEEGNGEKDKG